MTIQQKLDDLLRRLEELQQLHQNTSVEIIRLRKEIKLLQKEIKGYSSEPAPISKAAKIDEVPPAQIKEEKIPEVNIDFSKTKGPSVPPPLPRKKKSNPAPEKPDFTPEKAFDLEAFIGGNLINKIGILILIIGLGLFIKYAIDNGFFPPIVRLILSYLAGLSLVGIGYGLKAKYKAYSAVLFSGGMAVLYFSTYGGNAFIEPALIPRTTAFILMVVFTVVTVIAALIYDLQIIALLGLVGAYAVPILLSDGSGDYKLLFSYIAIINTGILAISVRRDWRISLYTAFLLTWPMFAFWLMMSFDSDMSSGVVWFFAITFFVIFYIALVIYHLFNKKEFTGDNFFFLILNALIFYGLGVVILNIKSMENAQGFFTLINALVHLIVSLAVYNRLEDKKLFFVASGLFCLFLTMAIGIEFEAETRVLLWLVQAALIFAIGRRFSLWIYEVISLLVLFIGISSLLGIWIEGYYEAKIHLKVISNKYFLTSALALMTFSVFGWLNKKWPAQPETPSSYILKALTPVLIFACLYLMFFHEIYHQFSQAHLNTPPGSQFNNGMLHFRTIWLINYSLVYGCILMLVNRFFIKNRTFGQIVSILSFFVIIAFLMGAFFSLSDLREAYLNPALTPEVVETSYWIWIRYLTYLLVLTTLYLIHLSLDQFDQAKEIRSFFRLFVHLVILVMLSSELTTAMRLLFSVESNSLAHNVGFSILWALYSLMMIMIGFRRRSKILRVAAIILFGITLLKVFFVDLVDISTESRILLFVAIGVLLLITSYLYQRHGHVLLGDEEEGAGA